MSAEPKNKPPVAKNSLGKSALSVWRNQSSKGREYHIIDLDQGIKQKDGTFKNVKLSLFPTDALILREMLDWALKATVDMTAQAPIDVSADVPVEGYDHYEE